jgi:hypothetical protein
LLCSIETGTAGGQTVDCTGIGIDAICIIDPSDIEFAPVELGSYADTSFVIYNGGGGVLDVDVTEVCDDFSILGGGGPSTLYSGDRVTVFVRYEPVSNGAHLCTVETGSLVCSTVPMSGAGYTCPPDSVYYVDADALGAGDGSSWADAFTDLQDALAVAWACPSVTQIWVAEGTYTPTGGTDRTESFEIYSSMAVYGGFEGTETLLSGRDFVSKTTILSGEIGSPGISDNSYHVVYAWGVDTTAVLDGFTVTGGFADSSSVYAWHGGGLHCTSGSPAISNVVFTGNRAVGYGGGAYAWTNARFLNVVFDGNTADYGGGLCTGGKNDSRIVNTIFTANTATVSGGGMYCEGNDPYILNSTFSGNIAGSGGGITCGAALPVSTNPVIVNTIFYGDSAATYPEIENVGTSVPVISYSLVDGCGGSGSWNSAFGTDGGGNLDSDPKFIDMEGGDLHLSALSPAVNAGDNGASFLPATDLDGGARIELGTVDMGTYEFACPTDTMLYVDADATGTGDGSSWGDACTELRSALETVEVCGSIKEIWVAEGTYLPTGDGDRTVSFQLRNGLTLYGGFSGTETSITERQVLTNVTVLSGDIGAQGDYSDNSYHVVSGNGTDSTAVIDGFTITGGNADWTGDYNDGGGMVVEEGSPDIINCVFTFNRADVRGAGLNIFDNSHPRVVGCVFIGNACSPSGGSYGGGLSINTYSDPVILSCSFYGNSAYYGGGIYHGNQSHATLTNVVMWGDTAQSGDNEINNGGTDITVSYSLVEGCGGSVSGWDPGHGIDGGGNIDADPLYADAASGDLRLTFPSPAINAGNNTAPGLPASDLEGNPRIALDVVDMGAFELQLQCPAGPVLFVDADASGAGDGSSWTDAYTDLQAALFYAICPGIDEIWVAEGTYLPTTGTDRYGTFSLHDSLKVYGGFAGGETDLDQRDIIANETILSGDIGVPDDPSDNSYNVVSSLYRDSTAVIDGFTITDGNGSGGMYVKGGGPIINNCIFLENQTNSMGAGLQIADTSSAKVINCLFMGNTGTGSSTYGGGISCYRYCDPLILNCSFYGNMAGRGGGLFNGSDCDATVTSVVMWGDSATFSGDNEIYSSGTDALVSYSLIEGCGGSGYTWDSGHGEDGGNNIDTDPLYLDPASGDLRLSAGSPAIDAGNSSAAWLPALDLDANPRISGVEVDMGAFEYSVVVKSSTVVIDRTGEEIYFIDDLDTLAVINFSSEDLDSVKVTKVEESPPYIEEGSDWVPIHYIFEAFPSEAAFEAWLKVFYDQEDFDNSGLTDETLIQLWRYDEPATMWEYKESIVDIDKNEITVTGVTGFSVWGITDSQNAVDVEEENMMPKGYVLNQNVPNPFNPTTTISFALPASESVSLRVYNIKGELVATLIDRHLAPGYKEITWDARDDLGKTVASGVYFYRLVAGSFVQTKKMVLLR